MIECAGQGYPQPVVSWEMVHVQELPRGAKVLWTGSLVIEAVALDHAGSYICRIKDQNGTTVVVKEIELEVKGEERVPGEASKAVSSVKAKMGVVH